MKPWKNDPANQNSRPLITKMNRPRVLQGHRQGEKDQNRPDDGIDKAEEEGGASAAQNEFTTMDGMR